MDESYQIYVNALKIQRKEKKHCVYNNSVETTLNIFNSNVIWVSEQSQM